MEATDRSGRDAPRVELRRSIGLPLLVLYGLGTTIGAGIYALTGVVVERAGAHAPVAFLGACGIALFSALSFAELSSRFPRAGGEAVYVREGLRRPGLSTAVGLLVVAAGLISAATVSVAFAGYLGEWLAVPRAATVAIVVLGIGGLAAWGVRESATAAALLTLVEAGGLLAVVALGAPALASPPPGVGALLPADLSAWTAVSGAAILAFYAFLGFEDMVNVAEEVRDVRRVLPRAILLTLAATAVLYFLVSTVAVRTVPLDELAASEAPLALVFERNGGSAAFMGVVAMLALVNGALIQVVKASRVLYGMAGHGGVPRALGRVHSFTRTPLLATGIATAATVALAVSFPLAVLAEATSVVTLTTFTLAHLSLVRVKRRDPAPPDTTRFPLWVPAVGFVVNLAFLAFEAWRWLVPPA